MTFRKHSLLILAVGLALSNPGDAQDRVPEFPIGGWFPGLFNNQEPDWPDRLDLVRDAHFTVIHASLTARNDPAVNQRWMDLAHDRGLKVQLYGWAVPSDWRGSNAFWSQTFEAESSVFTHNSMSGEVVAGEGRMADESRHSAGLLLDTPSTGSGIWLRGNGHNQYDYHVFWMKTDDNTGNEAIATINVIDHTTGTLIGTRPVLKSQFMDTINYQGFAIFSSGSCKQPACSLPSRMDGQRKSVDRQSAGK